MGRHGTKSPRSQVAAATPAPDAEAAAAPASEVPEATAEATAEQPGDDDLGGDSGAAAASSPAPEQHVWRADEPAAEDAGGAMVAAPTQTMAEAFGNEEEDSEEEDSEDDEEAEEQAVGLMAYMHFPARQARCRVYARAENTNPAFRWPRRTKRRPKINPPCANYPGRQPPGFLSPPPC